MFWGTPYFSRFRRLPVSWSHPGRLGKVNRSTWSLSRYLQFSGTGPVLTPTTEALHNLINNEYGSYAGIPPSRLPSTAHNTDCSTNSSGPDSDPSSGSLVSRSPHSTPLPQPETASYFPTFYQDSTHSSLSSYPDHAQSIRAFKPEPCDWVVPPAPGSKVDQYASSPFQSAHRPGTNTLERPWSSLSVPSNKPAHPSYQPAQQQEQQRTKNMFGLYLSRLPLRTQPRPNEYAANRNNSDPMPFTASHNAPNPSAVSSFATELPPDDSTRHALKSSCSSSRPSSRKSSLANAAREPTNLLSRASKPSNTMSPRQERIDSISKLSSSSVVPSNSSDTRSIRELSEDEDDFLPVLPSDFDSYGPDRPSRFNDLGDIDMGFGCMGQQNGGRATTPDLSGKDDYWGVGKEEYEKLNAKARKQLRNKIGARRFRERRKEYITTLESRLAERDDIIKDLRARLEISMKKNRDFKNKLAHVES
ncbi:bzip transcription factor [Phaffia rhodozyma]|uniref:Bzip transcription factor n=1 Tax=Phaffia rhodozyma TaxID=264483 RepID=A0A0F7SQY5_PHARH|nr:bzip transcription factor [Phaffia rhodozyma]